MNKTNRTDINFTPDDVMKDTKRKNTAKHMVAIRTEFKEARSKEIGHKVKANVKLTSTEKLIKARIKFTENRIKVNHMLTEIVEKRLGKASARKIELERILTKITAQNTSSLTI